MAGSRRTNVVLIGYRGSGKSTVGRLLAECMSLEFVDTDERVSTAAGRTIAEIFAREGEPGFRAHERRAIQEATSRGGRVISAGGGVVEAEENRADLAAYGTVVWLRASAEVLWKRMSADPTSAEARPNLGSGGLEEVRLVLSRRAPLYEEMADHALDVSESEPRAIVAGIMSLLGD